MKLNRRDLRRLIESVINEENPGSKFAAAEKKGKQNKSATNKQKATQELQKTYDWFVDTVFPAIENDEWPIKVDDKYYTYAWDARGQIHFGEDEQYLVAPVGTIIKSVDQALDDTTPPQTLSKKYYHLERSVIQCGLRVTMQSEQPDEFEEEVAKAKKDPRNPGNPNKTGAVNESLSRGALYRRRYHGRY